MWFHVPLSSFPREKIAAACRRRKREQITFTDQPPSQTTLPSFCKCVFAWKLIGEAHLGLTGTLTGLNEHSSHSLHFRYLGFRGRPKNELHFYSEEWIQVDSVGKHRVCPRHFWAHFSVGRSSPVWWPGPGPCAVGESTQKRRKVNLELLPFNTLSNQQASFAVIAVFKALPTHI